MHAYKTIMNIFPTAAMDASTTQLITQVNDLAKLLDELTTTMSPYYETTLLIAIDNSLIL